MHTERDVEILNWIGCLGAAGADHVMERFEIGRSLAYRRLSRLVLEGLVAPWAVLHRQPALYVATGKGLRTCGLERLGACRIGPGRFLHAREVANAAIALERGFPGSCVVSEREIRVDEAECGKLIASAKLGELPGGRLALHRPDLAVISPDGHVIAVEVELSAKAPRRLATICRGWARARHVHTVYYLAAPAVMGLLERAIEQARARDRIAVIALADVRRLAAWAREEAADVVR
jgi:hypothetical protein